MKSLQNISLSPHLFWFVIGLYVIARFALSGLNYQGDTRPESRERVLKHFTQEQLEQGTRYHRAGFAVSVAFALASIAVLLLFILGGYSLRLSRITLDWSGGRPWLQVILYVTILMIGTWILSLPFEFYLDYVLEHRFEFSRHTPVTWLKFQVQTTLIGLVTTLIVASVVYAMLRHWPRAWVFIVPVFILGFQLSYSVVFPRTILPLLYRIEPVTEQDYIAAINDVARKAGVEIKAMRWINESQYSSHTNAFFIGFGRFKEIYLFDTLRKDHTPDEVGAILAHELGHWKHNHVMKGILLSTAATLLACILLYLFFPVAARSPFLQVGPLHDVSSLPLLALLVMVLGFFTSPIENGVSRYFERQADEMAIELTRRPDILVRDFKQLALSNHSDLLPHPLLVLWRYSHPPVLDRIEAAQSAP